MEEMFNGCTGVGEKDTDYLLGNDIFIELARAHPIEYRITYEYNQYKVPETKSYCTVYSAITMLSYLMNKEFTNEEIKSIGDKMVLDGKLVPGRGRDMGDAIDYVRRWWNENNEDKIESYRFSLRDKKLRKRVDDYLGFQMGYKSSIDLSKELYFGDGMAMQKVYDTSGGGHAVFSRGLHIINSYKGVIERNRSAFEYFDDLLENKVIYPFGYVFFKSLTMK